MIFWFLCQVTKKRIRVSLHAQLQSCSVSRSTKAENKNASPTLFIVSTAAYCESANRDLRYSIDEFQLNQNYYASKSIGFVDKSGLLFDSNRHHWKSIVRLY